MIRQQSKQPTTTLSPHPKPSDITSQQVLAEFSGYVTHEHYQCLLYFWTSQLWVKQPNVHSKPLWVVYVEYRNHTRCCCYKPFYFDELQRVHTFIQLQVTQCKLPNVSPKTTRESPVGRGH